MEELLKIALESGISVLIVFVFVHDWVTTRKSMSETLKQNARCLEEIKNTNDNIAESNKNTAKSLEILQSTLDKHDKRCEEIQKDVKEISLKVRR